MIEIEPVSEAQAINMVHEVQEDLTSVTHKTVYLPLLTKVGTKKEWTAWTGKKHAAGWLIGCYVIHCLTAKQPITAAWKKCV